MALIIDSVVLASDVLVINGLKQAHRIIFREHLPPADALAKVEKEIPPLAEVQHLVAFIRASERGVAK